MRQLTCSDRLCIHPYQTEPVHHGLAHSEAKLARACRVLAASEAAEVCRDGVIAPDRQAISAPVAAQAWKLLAATGGGL